MRFARTITALTLVLGLSQVAISQDRGRAASEQQRRDDLKIAVQKICPVSGQKLGAHGKPIKVAHRQGACLSLLQRLPQTEGGSQALGDDSRQLCPGTRHLPCHEAQAAQEPQVDNCGRPDRLHLLPSLYQEDRG